MILFLKLQPLLNHETLDAIQIVALVVSSTHSSKKLATRYLFNLILVFQVLQLSVVIPISMDMAQKVNPL